TPNVEIGWRRALDAEGREHLSVETSGVIGLRHRIDVVDVARLDHGAFTHIAEQRELAPLLGGDRPVGAAEQNVGLDADRTQLFHGVLGRLGLELAGAGDEGQEREMDVDGAVARKIVAELADRLEERQALDVADRAADLAKNEIIAVVAVANELLDGVGDVRDHLDGGAEIVAAPLLGQDLLIDAAGGGVVLSAGGGAGGDVVLWGGGASGEALIMAEVEVSLRPIISDEDLAVLVGRHRAWVDIEIGVELAQPYLVAARLQQRAERGRCETFAQGGDH